MLAGIHWKNINTHRLTGSRRNSPEKVYTAYAKFF